MKVNREEMKVAACGEQELWLGRQVQRTPVFHNNLCCSDKKIESFLKNLKKVQYQKFKKLNLSVSVFSSIKWEYNDLIH